MLNKLNKKGQVGETVTWVVATLIIVIVLVSFIYASSVLSKVKILTSLSFESELEGNWMEKKMFFSENLSGNKNKEKIMLWIEEGEENE